MVRASQVLARLTWVVLALVFVGVLGGLHPSDRNETASSPGDHLRLRDLIAATPDCPPP